MESSQRLGSAAMDLLWTLAERFPQVVLEANFRPHSEYERSGLVQLGSSVEVYCRCPSKIAAARFAQRARDASHHPVHILHELPAELLAEYDGPMAIGEVLEVDTTEPIDTSLVAGDVQTLLRRLGGNGRPDPRDSSGPHR